MRGARRGSIDTITSFLTAFLVVASSFLAGAPGGPPLPAPSEACGQDVRLDVPHVTTPLDVGVPASFGSSPEALLRAEVGPLSTSRHAATPTCAGATRRSISRARRLRRHFDQGRSSDGAARNERIARAGHLSARPTAPPTPS